MPLWNVGVEPSASSLSLSRISIDWMRDVEKKLEDGMQHAS